MHQKWLDLITLFKMITHLIKSLLNFYNVKDTLNKIFLKMFNTDKRGKCKQCVSLIINSLETFSPTTTIIKK